ncbi:MAG: radical SAM protein [Clostridia bacterium]|nr:radical SAM protein [Clostridia bacterium]
MDKCFLCPNGCGVDRENGVGRCSVKANMKIAKYYPHPFEEPPVSGSNGSGAIFFTGCPLKCVFCQNYDLSRNTRGKEITPKELADIFIELEEKGVHNINLVTATQFADKLIEAFNIYKPKIPVLLNSHGYEKIQTLEMLNPYIDVYLPDMKYVSPAVSKRYTGKENYFEVAKESVEFMINAKPPVYEDGLIQQGVIVRHLILPMNTDDSKRVLDWFAPFKDRASFSLMSQYTPFGEINAFPELKRKITKREYRADYDYALSLGITDMFVEGYESSDEKYIPSWDY